MEVDLALFALVSLSMPHIYCNFSTPKLAPTNSYGTRGRSNTQSKEESGFESDREGKAGVWGWSGAGSWGQCPTEVFVSWWASHDKGEGTFLLIP